MKVAVSWSGGKECTLALYKVVLEGLSVSYLFNMISHEGRIMAHGLDSDLIIAQAKSIEIPLLQFASNWDTYERDFKIALHKIKEKGIKGVVFGDIREIPGHGDWIDRVCKEVGLQPIKPLWGLNTRQLIYDLIKNNFKTIIIRTKADILGKEWLGRTVNKCFLTDLKELKTEIDFCGELGEYHTFVVDGPLFKRRIEIIKENKMLKDGYWSLDILEYEVIKK